MFIWKNRALLLIGLGLLFLIGKAVSENGPFALPAGGQAGADAQPAVRSISWPAYEGVKTETVRITKSTSQLFRFDRPITRAAVSNPNICDITTIGGQDVLVNAKDAGVANLIVWDDSNNVAAYNLESVLDLEKLKKILAAIDPASELKMEPFNNTVAVYGTTETSLNLRQMAEAAKAFDKEALNFMQLKESKQVLLEVRFAEITQRNNKDFKLDAEAISGFFAFRNLTGQTGVSTVETDSSFTPARGAATYEPVGLPSQTHVNLFGSYTSSSTLISNFLKWLEQKNVLKIIARPNLVAKDGEEAEFVVGGEFPVPISNLDRIVIDYKEFGTKLKFTPEVLTDKRIRLKVYTEVSELDFTNTVNLGGIVVPSIIKRNHKTIAELADNQSLVIGGLITQKINRINRKVPLLGDIPLLKVLFSSEEFARTDVELLVVITPHLVRPIELNEQKTFHSPGDVKDATRTYLPETADRHLQSINRLITQNEDFLDFHQNAQKADEAAVRKLLGPEKSTQPSE